MFGYGAAMPTGIELIAAERDRQIEELGYDAEHDRHHEDELAYAAACYAAPEAIFLVKVEQGLHTDPQSGVPAGALGAVKWVEPWPDGWRRPERAYTAEERVEELAKVGALAAAEIDRIQLEHGLTDDDVEG